MVKLEHRNQLLVDQVSSIAFTKMPPLIFYWSGMRATVIKVIKSDEACQAAKLSGNKAAGGRQWLYAECP